MPTTQHPARRWQAAAQQPALPHNVSLRLAAMAGHMARDPVAARRAALVDILADGRPHLREELWARVAEQLDDDDCWGRIPREALARDLRALREGGLRIGYARRSGIEGYYLEDPPVNRPVSHTVDETSWELVEAIRGLSVAEKNERAFAAADWALRQKRLQLAAQNPAWDEDRVAYEARALVYGTPPAGQDPAP